MRFDSYHPMINFIYFTSVIVAACVFTHPVCLAISFLCAFFYSLKLYGRKSLAVNLVFLGLAFFYTFWYCTHHHFGVTVLWKNFIGNRITAEAFGYGLERGMTIAAILIWFSCIFKLVTADKIVYLFGRISPKLSLFLSILLRTIPRVGTKAKRIQLSRAGIGKGIRQGNLLEKAGNFGSFLSILITWTIEDFVESANSMKSRGYSLKGRTAFSIYRFDNRDRVIVILLFAGITMMVSAQILGMTYSSYDPVICMYPMNVGSCLFYIAYAGYLLLPLGLQLFGEYNFEKSKTM